MPGFLIRLVVNALAIAAASWMVGIEIAGISGLVVTALALAVVNALIRPLVFCISLPLQVVTLGLFTFVLNALMFWLALWVASMAGSAVTPDFGTAFLGALIVSIVSWVLSIFIR